MNVFVFLLPSPLVFHCTSKLYHACQKPHFYCPLPSKLSQWAPFSLACQIRILAKWPWLQPGNYSGITTASADDFFSEYNWYLLYTTNLWPSAILKRNNYNIFLKLVALWRRERAKDNYFGPNQHSRPKFYLTYYANHIVLQHGVLTGMVNFQTVSHSQAARKEPTLLGYWKLECF